MSLLSIEQVSKRYRHGRGEHVVLKEVSLAVDPGELVAVLGRRRSGRTTLLRLAAGLELPDEGRVRFNGHDLAGTRSKVLGKDIGFVQTHFDCAVGGLVIDHVAAGVLAQDQDSSTARRNAREVLARVGTDGLDNLAAHELDAAESARVGIARALICSPRLLVVDEPTNGVEPLDRDPIMALLRSIANEGIAVLMTTGDATALSVDRVLSIGEGELRGNAMPVDATVVPLRRSVRQVTVESERAG
jgi:putative ABC transport system ATP-binding protein